MCVVTFPGFGEVRPLGQGGQGRTFRARHGRSGREVVLKLPLEPPEADPELRARLRARFRGEIRHMMAALAHPHVVEILGEDQAVVEDCRRADCPNRIADRTCFLAMEFCGGGSADELIQRHYAPKPPARPTLLPIDQALRLAGHLLAGLEHLHQVRVPNVPLADGGIGAARGLVHRDIKPANLFLTEPDPAAAAAKIGDLGLAKAFDWAGQSAGGTHSTQTLGTLLYMPRQQFGNTRYVGPEVDVWAAAATLYALLTGRTPRSQQLLRTRGPGAFFASRPRPVQALRPDLPAALAALLDRALDDGGAELPVRAAAELRQGLVAAG